MNRLTITLLVLFLGAACGKNRDSASSFHLSDSHLVCYQGSAEEILSSDVFADGSSKSLKAGPCPVFIEVDQDVASFYKSCPKLGQDLTSVYYTLIKASAEDRNQSVLVDTYELERELDSQDICDVITAEDLVR